MGTNIPIMGKDRATTRKPAPGGSDAAAPYRVSQQTTGLADVLFTQTQQRVLGMLFGQPDSSFTVSEIIAAAGVGSGSVQRELARLGDSGLATVRKIGNQKHYQANVQAPIYAELVGIMRKTTGLAEPLRAALAPLAGEIAAAFIYGSMAKRSDTASSDIDLLIISDTLAYAEAFSAVEPVAQRLGRAVNPTIYTRAELAKRIRANNAFIIRVLEQPKLWLIGDEHDLGA